MAKLYGFCVYFWNFFEKFYLKINFKKICVIYQSKIVELDHFQSLKKLFMSDNKLNF